ncbi:Phosphatidate cytidylyltransferase 3 [Zea mays]|uniref:Phosphatidate cytidylyltransferase 3 n=1 Tax=Zea mays TaxID=4577 RepID=A0A1D6KTM9_MAIZE|nr:Phosphatidate cytidylyltransferase 3 [Zea mays]
MFCLPSLLSRLKLWISFQGHAECTVSIYPLKSIFWRTEAIQVECVSQFYSRLPASSTTHKRTPWVSHPLLLEGTVTDSCSPWYSRPVIACMAAGRTLGSQRIE